MLEFSGWIQLNRQPLEATAKSGAEGEFWNRRGNVIDEAGVRVITVDMDSSRVHVHDDGTGRFTVAYTGTLTNGPALRSTLRSRGHDLPSDRWVDVIAAAFHEWGDSFVEHLEGTFAIALRDTDGSVRLIRDRLGSKPLYYAEYEGGIVFSTRAGRVLTHPRIEPWMRPEGLILALNPRLVMLGETPLANLREVTPAHMLFASADRRKESCYWRLESRPHEDSSQDTVATVRELLGTTVAEHAALAPDHGMLMSGGLDSTAVAALAAGLRDRGGPPIRTFSLEFKGDATDFKPSALRPEPDGPYAKRVARELGTEHHAFVLTTEQLLGALEEARDARGMPGWGQFDTSFLVVAKLIRQECPTVLTGSFADEIFGGYPWFHDPEVLASDTFPWLGNAPRVWTALNKEFVNTVDPSRIERERYEALLARVPRLATDSPHEARIREAFFLGLQGPMAVNGERGERMSVAAGLSAPSPYTDHKLLQYVWNVPWSLKNQAPGWKHLLKQAVRDVVPQVVLDRKKSGYPGTHDPEYARQTMRQLTEIANDPSAPLHPFMDQEQLARFTKDADDTMTFTNAAHMLIPVVETDTWMRRFGVKVR